MFRFVVLFLLVFNVEIGSTHRTRHRRNWRRSRHWREPRHRFRSRSHRSPPQTCSIASTYDFIIVGAGTAGSIVAARLSEDPKNRVLLIEEGGWSDQWEISKNPSKWWNTLLEPQITREYFTQAEPHLNGRRIWEPRGKMTGGCNSHNAMVYILGNRKDFDERWGVSGWSWDDLAPYWAHIEGSFTTTRVAAPNDKWMSRFLAAGVENGFLYNPDPNDLSSPQGQGGMSIRRQMVAISGTGVSTRQSAWTAYTEPALSRPNLDVIVYTRVNKLLFKFHSNRDGRHHPKVIGVETYGIGDRKVQNFWAKKEVILSAGVFDTPKILMLSGIGDCEYLNTIGVRCTAHVPGVGKGLQDHTYTNVVSPPLLNQNRTELELPDDSIFGVWGALAIDDNGDFYNGLGFNIAPDGRVAVASNSEPFHYEMRGEVKLADDNPTSQLLISQGWLASHADRAKYLAVFRKARELIYSSNLMPYYQPLIHEISPGHAVQSDDEIIEWARANIGTDFHPAGTCKMGTRFDEANANSVVVDTRLRVRGVKQLRVVDGSVMPELISGNPNQVTMIIGFKGADMILADL